MIIAILTHLVHIQFPTLLHREGQFVVFKELCDCRLGILHTNHFMASFCQPKTHQGNYRVFLLCHDNPSPL